MTQLISKSSEQTNKNMPLHCYILIIFLISVETAASMLNPHLNNRLVFEK